MQKHSEESADEAAAERKYSLPNETDAKVADQSADCPKCGGREWVVEPGLTGIVFSMPCPVCNGEAA